MPYIPKRNKTVTSLRWKNVGQADTSWLSLNDFPRQVGQADHVGHAGFCATSLGQRFAQQA
jgi:hypothetical protein